MLHILRPEKAPGFAYAWLEIVSHRFFMDKILNNYNQKGWPVYAQLLVDLFKFLSSFLRNAELARPVNRYVLSHPPRPPPCFKRMNKNCYSFS